MKIVIAGGGSVGRFIAEQLVANSHDVLIVDSDPDVVHHNREVAGKDSPVRWLRGDGCDVEVLKAAGMEQADVIAAVTGDDEDNLVISLLAKQEFAVPRVVARVNHPKNEWLFNEAWGVDHAVSTPHILTAVVEEAVAVGSLVRLLNFADANLVEVRLASDSPAAGKTVVELGVPRDATIVALIRERHVLVPRGETVFAVGDEVLCLVTGDAEDDVRRLLIGNRVPG